MHFGGNCNNDCCIQKWMILVVISLCIVSLHWCLGVISFQVNGKVTIKIYASLIVLFVVPLFICPGFRNQDSPCLRVMSPVCYGFLRLTSGVKPADLLTATMTSKSILVPIAFSINSGNRNRTDVISSQ